ncbi:cupin domain-containing protein [Sphingomonas corticis]|jgi:mannose-6-phosphate isomerase-like protein (cupin superfamily)|uniref:Cupin domain-containing protein n=1 Tax=Sphingomonas corticis TaxID=2722791 RepID=A0ABX1CK32_9SPHN|nr:cupin domain-containing protein [Sphingomonas corticis]NJR78351.1 cupin domain-containing protein [Sphingomonas corticis]
MIEPLPPVRRVVTAIDADGRSFIAEAGPSPAGFALPGSPFRSDNIWRTHAAPAPVDAPDDIAAHRGVLPPAGGTVLRVIDFPPMEGTREEQAALAAKVFALLYPDADHQVGSDRSAGMHTTDTVDYAIVLAGEIYAVMDQDEALLTAGDVLIQRGTAHSWENRSRRMARVAFVLVDGVRG